LKKLQSNTREIQLLFWPSKYELEG